MALTLNTFDKGIIRQHKCKRCGAVLAESGCFRFPGQKEVRMVGAWRKETTYARVLKHPMDPSRIIAIDLHCRCNRCGISNVVMIAAAFDDKKKIRLQYNRLQEAQGVLHT